MKKIKVFETFAGIGAQHKALEILKDKTGIEYEIVGTSEWDARTNISYELIHEKKSPKQKESSLAEWRLKGNNLKQFTHSMNTKTPYKSSNDIRAKYGNKFYKDLEMSYANNNNQGSIVDIHGEKLINNIGDFDLLTYSFPCQDLSTAGGFHHGNRGMKRGSGTRSGLLWEVERILKEIAAYNKSKLPKYLLLENVKNMLSKQHINDYVEWLKELNKLGYSTQTFLLNAKDFGIPQNRERVYAISVLNNKKFIDTFETRKNDNKFKTIREKVIENPKDKVVDISDELEINRSLDEILKLDYSNQKYFEEAIEATANNTESRTKMKKENPYLFILEKNKKQFDKMTAYSKSLYNFDESKKGWFRKISRTVTTKQDRSPNSGIIDVPKDFQLAAKKATGRGKESFRFLTPREAFLLMGFSEKDFEMVKTLGKPYGINNEILYREAGNSIVVNVLCAVFHYMFKF